MRRRSLPQVVIEVHSASMTRDELFELITRHEGRRLPCMQLHRRPDGTIVTRDCFAPLVRVGRFLGVKVALAAVAFWAWALGIRPLARHVNEALNETRTAVSRGDVVMGRGMGLVTTRDDEPQFLAPGRLAPLPPPPAKAGPALLRPLLSEIDRPEPLRYLEADQEIHQRLEPERSRFRRSISH